MQESYVLYRDNNKEYVDELIEYLKSKDIEAIYEEDPSEELHCILVPDESKHDAKAILSEYFNKELYEEEENLDELLYEKSTVYVKSADKYSDLKSSGISLIAVAILGIIFIILKITNVISFDFYGIYDVIFTILFSVIFLAVLFFGIYSLFKAKKIAGNINSEDEATDSILNWFIDNFTAELIDSSIEVDDAETPVYFKRTEYMKMVINNKFKDLDEGYVESLIEELYSEYFES